MPNRCAVHTHREYVPIEIHHIWPKGMGGPDIAANKIAICSNAHSAVHEYMRLLTRYAGAPPLRERLRFGYRLRRLAADGWAQAQAQAPGGSDAPGAAPPGP